MADSSTSQTLLQDMCSDTSAGRTLCRRLRKAWNLHWYPCLPHLCFRMDHGRSADHATKFPVFRDMPQSPVWGTRNGPACSSKHFVSNRYSSRSETSSWPQHRTGVTVRLSPNACFSPSHSFASSAQPSIVALCAPRHGRSVLAQAYRLSLIALRIGSSPSEVRSRSAFGPPFGGCIEFLGAFDDVPPFMASLHWTPLEFALNSWAVHPLGSAPLRRATIGPPSFVGQRLVLSSSDWIGCQVV